MQAFAEGGIFQSEWCIWFEQHAVEIEAQFGRYAFLSMKLRGRRGVYDCLDRIGVAFQMPEHICHRCGEVLFEVMPGETSAEEIIDFARRSHLDFAKDIEQNAWLHPGRYCPNGCTVTLWNIREGW